MSLKDLLSICFGWRTLYVAVGMVILTRKSKGPDDPLALEELEGPKHSKGSRGCVGIIITHLHLGI